MIERVKHNAGFTLAELLLSIAIIMVLAAIAIPSIVTAQNNMRMVELNNAAQSIANAAQTQMTAMKVSGTWLAFLDGRAGGSGDRLLRDEARSSEIITSLSIDATVYDGDYVIVFDRDTASVTAVYYTDGKTGFFGEAPASTNAAQTYYENGGSPDQAARMANNPMIGYYQGTPAGATDAVALENPVIWVSDAEDTQGKLCVRDQNLTASPARNTSIEIEFSKLNEKGEAGTTFVLSGLASDESLLTIEASGRSTGASVVKGEGIYAFGSDGTYVIDLNKLANWVSKSSFAAEIKDAVNDFHALDAVQVKATVEIVGPCVPATAKANIEWPLPLTSLSVLVTDPETEGAARAQHVSGTYKKPVVGTEGDPSVLAEKNWNTKETTESFSLRFNTAGLQAGYYDNASKGLATQNEESVHQSYSGGTLGLEIAVTNNLKVNATVGGYSNNATEHLYQIYEIWAYFENSDSSISQYEKMGYLRNNAWVWSDADFANCLLDSAIQAETTNVQIVASNVKTYLNTKFADSSPDDISCSIYIRTAPRFDDVDTYLRANPSTMNSFSGNVGTGSRGGNLATEVRKAFESEFGAASSIASWAVARTKSSGVYINNWEFPGNLDDLRIYYDITPAYGFSSLGASDDWPTVSNDARFDSTNTGLWYFPKKGSTFDTATPVAILWEPAETAAEQAQTMVRNTDGSPGSSVDFEISHVQDYLFYRCVTFFSEEGKELLESPAKMYVPYSDAAATPDAYLVPSAENKPSENKVFAYWTTEPNGGGEKVYPNMPVSDYESLFPALSGTKPIKTPLYAHYITIGVGLMYLEFSDTEKTQITGYYGYLSEDDKGPTYDLPKENSIKSWGYYVVTPVDTKLTLGEGALVVGPAQSVKFESDGKEYFAYEIVGSWQYKLEIAKRDPRHNLTYSYSDPSSGETYSGTYEVNFNFAGAVAKVGGGSNWGKSDSPWIVRHATQFVGALPANGNPNIQQTYTTNSVFRQMHDIDMADAAVTAITKFTKVLSQSTYDGNNFTVRGIQYRLGIDGITGEDSGNSGLFVNVVSSTIKNVKIEVDPNTADRPYTITSTHNSKMAFGLLVGNMSGTGSNVENCSVSVKNDGDAYFLIEKNGSNGVDIGNSVGVLAGRASEVVMTQLSASGIHLSVNTTDDSWRGSIALGSLVGRALQCNISACNTTKTELELKQPVEDSAKATLSYGGIAGQFEGCNESGCMVEDARLRVAHSQSGDNMRVGGVVGFSSGSILSSNTWENQAFLYTGDGEAEAITLEAGVQQ